MVEELPFSQKTIDLAFAKRLFFFFLTGKRFSFYICFRTIAIASQTIYQTVSPVNDKIVFGFLVLFFISMKYFLRKRSCSLMRLKALATIRCETQ